MPGLTRKKSFMNIFRWRKSSNNKEQNKHAPAVSQEILLRRQRRKERFTSSRSLMPESSMMVVPDVTDKTNSGSETSSSIKSESSPDSFEAPSPTTEFHVGGAAPDVQPAGIYNAHSMPNVYARNTPVVAAPEPTMKKQKSTWTIANLIKGNRRLPAKLQKEHRAKQQRQADKTRRLVQGNRPISEPRAEPSDKTKTWNAQELGVQIEEKEEIKLRTWDVHEMDEMSVTSAASASNRSSGSSRRSKRQTSSRSLGYKHHGMQSPSVAASKTSSRTSASRSVSATQILASPVQQPKERDISWRPFTGGDNSRPTKTTAEKRSHCVSIAGLRSLDNVSNQSSRSLTRPPLSPSKSTRSCNSLPANMATGSSSLMMSPRQQSPRRAASSRRSPGSSRRQKFSPRKAPKSPFMPSSPSLSQLTEDVEIQWSPSPNNPASVTGLPSALPLDNSGATSQETTSSTHLAMKLLKSPNSVASSSFSSPKSTTSSVSSHKSPLPNAPMEFPLSPRSVKSASKSPRMLSPFSPSKQASPSTNVENKLEIPWSPLTVLWEQPSKELSLGDATSVAEVSTAKSVVAKTPEIKADDPVDVSATETPATKADDLVAASTTESQAPAVSEQDQKSTDADSKDDDDINNDSTLQGEEIEVQLCPASPTQELQQEEASIKSAVVLSPEKTTVILPLASPHSNKLSRASSTRSVQNMTSLMTGEFRPTPTKSVSSSYVLQGLEMKTAPSTASRATTNPMDRRLWKPAAMLSVSCVKGSPYARNYDRHLKAKHVSFAKATVTLIVPARPHMANFLHVVKDSLWWPGSHIRSRQNYEASQWVRNPDIQEYNEACISIRKYLTDKIAEMKSDNDLCFTHDELVCLLSPQLVMGMRLGHRGHENGGLMGQFRYNRQFCRHVLDQYHNNGNPWIHDQRHKRRSRLNGAEKLANMSVEGSEADRVLAHILALGDERFADDDLSAF